MQTGFLGVLIFFGFALALLRRMAVQAQANGYGSLRRRQVSQPSTIHPGQLSRQRQAVLGDRRVQATLAQAACRTATGKPAKARIPCGVRATVIGHATILLQVDGLNILTDPVMGDRIGANRLLSVKRQMAPGLSLEQLPVINVSLLSHIHFDHLDIPSLQAIVERQPAHAPLVLTDLGNADLLQGHGITHVKEMDWGDSLEVSGERIDFLEAVHESGRFNYVDDKSLWGLSSHKLPARSCTLQGIRPTAT